MCNTSQDINTALMQEPPAWVAPSPLPARFETPRLVLRFHEPSDAESLFCAIEACRDSLLPWMIWAKTDHRALHETVYFIEKCRRARLEPGATNFVVGIFDKATGEVVGSTGLHRMEHPSHEAEIGYWIRADRRCQGLCTEATRGILSWAFLPKEQGGWGLRRVHIRCAVQNLPSQAVPIKIGLRHELRLVQHRFIPGIGWTDTLGWGVLAEEWDVAEMRLRS